MAKTLLQKALEVGSGRKIYGKYSDEHVELALAWLRGEVGTTQVGSVLSTKQNAQGTLSILLRKAYEQGKLVIK